MKCTLSKYNCLRNFQ